MSWVGRGVDGGGSRRLVDDPLHFLLLADRKRLGGARPELPRAPTIVEGEPVDDKREQLDDDHG